MLKRLANWRSRKSLSSSARGKLLKNGRILSENGRFPAETERLESLGSKPPLKCFTRAWTRIFKMAAIKHAKTYGFSPNPFAVFEGDNKMQFRGAWVQNCVKMAGIFGFFSSKGFQWCVMKPYVFVEAVKIRELLEATAPNSTFQKSPHL